MRVHFEQQLSLGSLPISEVEIDLKNRHELPPVLAALQHIFVTTELNRQVFAVLEQRICSGKKETGRYGMSLWEIFVLACVRLNLDIDFDFLLDLANQHNDLRGILGVQKTDFTAGKKYAYQTIVDNVTQLDEQTLKTINEIIVKEGHNIIKKKVVQEEEILKLEIKVDSYVVQTNVHFPTDINLMWDCARKCLDYVSHLSKKTGSLKGWRELESWKKKTKNCYRRSSEIHRKKENNYHNRLKASVEQYLTCCRIISHKCEQTLNNTSIESTLEVLGYLVVLQDFKNLLDSHIDLVNRRIILGETIPHKEKMFSIFEQHTEWLNKGKLHKNVELGLNTLIATDQYGFIVHHHVMQKQTDKDLAQSVAEAIGQNFNNCELNSISYDRGFYSGPAKEAIGKVFNEVIMPKPGKKSKKQEEEESSKTFIALRKSHSTVEANINQLEHHGVNKCPDKGIFGFKRYVALGVIAYNLHHLGNLFKNSQST